MRIRYIGAHDAVVVPLTYGGEIECAKGGTISVTDELGARLLEQEENWQLVLAEKKSTKAADSAGEG